MGSMILWRQFICKYKFTDDKQQNDCMGNENGFEMNPKYINIKIVCLTYNMKVILFYTSMCTKLLAINSKSPTMTGKEP